MNSSNIAANTVNTAQTRLVKSAQQNKEYIFNEYQIAPDGLSTSQVKEMRHKYGKNSIARQKKASVAKRLFNSFVNPFTIVLFILAGVSIVTDIITVAPQDRSYTSVIIVMIMVIISGTLSFVQEAKSSAAAEKLRNMIKTNVLVKRKNADQLSIPIDELVVGDILYLAAGDMIPADVRLLHTKDLFISQSSLTGESEPLEKVSSQSDDKSENPIDYKNLAFMGSNVISGSATAIVLAVGNETLFGNIAKQLTTKSPPNNFEKGISAISWVFIRFMLIMVPIVFFINGFTKGSWIEALLFALSVAIGLTPEMLPVIVTANLAKGANSMAKKKVIVKSLKSIQNFGAMDILCTDKTGTLTQDKIILEYHLKANGENDEDGRVLRHAFLNSYFQTGLKNLMDVSIIDHALKDGMEHLKTDYHKVDEVPFDFNRRRMSVVVEDKNGKTQMVTKGAIEEMLSICSFVEYDGQVVELTEEIKKKVVATAGKYNNDGMRVLGVAQKLEPSEIGVFSVKDEQDMVLIGYLAFLDPPKEDAAKAIKTLNNYGIQVKVLTGDNKAVTSAVCKQVGIDGDNIILGADIEAMDDKTLNQTVENYNIFAKLSPSQKSRIVLALRNNGHVVGYMGDGINDANAMKSADIGISVDSAVDIAKETANIILLKKDLLVLSDGVLEGRKTYANTIKYIKTTASSNFGNMFSVLVASAFLPFLPMLPLQILLLNLIYDISCTSIPWDNVGKDYLRRPRKWDASSVSKFMIWFGPTSSIFDITTFALMFFFVCPWVLGMPYSQLSGSMQLTFAAIFQAGWFLESLWTQTFVIHMLRTPKFPFIQSHASWQVTLITTLGVAFGTLLTFIPIGKYFGLMQLPWIYFPILLAIIALYMTLVTFVKKTFIKRYESFL